MKCPTCGSVAWLYGPAHGFAWQVPIYVCGGTCSQREGRSVMFEADTPEGWAGNAAALGLSSNNARGMRRNDGAGDD